MNRRSLILALPVVAATAACAPAPMPDGPHAGHGMVTVGVTATYRERILLTPGHVLTIKVEDVSRADASAIVMAEHVETLDGRGPPYSVQLGFPASQVNPNYTYAVRAEIRDPQGRLRFTTDTRHAVLTYGAPSNVDIVMVGVR